MEVLKSQRNDVLRCIRDAGLEPLEFEWRTEPSRRSRETNLISVLVHTSTGFFFRFDFGSAPMVGRYQLSEFSPGEDLQVEIDGNEETWSDRLTNTRRWLYCLKREIGESDLWAKLAEEHRFAEVAGSTGLENDTFTPDEQKKVSAALREVREFAARLVEGQDDTAARLRIIDDRVQHMDESSKRLGRKDWLSMVLGSLVGICMTGAIESDEARELVRFAGEKLSVVYDSLRALLP